MHCTLCHNSPPPVDKDSATEKSALQLLKEEGQVRTQTKIARPTLGRGVRPGGMVDLGGSSKASLARVSHYIVCTSYHMVVIMTEKGIGCGKSLGGQKGEWCQKESGGEQGLDWRRYGVLLWVLRFMNNYCYIRRPSPEQETTTGQWRDGQDSQCQIFSRLDQRGGSQQVCCVCVCFKVCTVG